jgi:hypothetical protein
MKRPRWTGWGQRRGLLSGDLVEVNVHFALHSIAGHCGTARKASIRQVRP